MNLEFLDLSQNQISELSGVSNLRNLSHLFLRDNKISSIESGILENLENLQHFDLENNQLTTVIEVLKINPRNPLSIHLDRDKMPKDELAKLKMFLDQLY